MCFGQAPGHFEKHLPTITRDTFSKLGQENGQSYTGILSAMQLQAKAAGGKFETFDGGPTLFKAKGMPGRVDDEVEITVERDDLVGGEDQIELALHMTTNGKEETLLPAILRFTFSMKMEGDTWRLNEVSATARFPIADPTFLKAMQEHQVAQNEQIALMSVRSIVYAEKSYQSARSSFACKLSDLGNSGKDAPRRTYLFDQQLASGKKSGYMFSISECDPSHYHLAAEPVAPELGQHAYCSDETGAVRKSADGKAATCFVSGEVVEDKTHSIAMLQPAPQGGSASGSFQPGGRVRVSQGVATGLLPAGVSSRRQRASEIAAPTGVEDLRVYAVSRLLLHNIPHIKAYWIMLGLKTAQTAQWFGSDDLDGTVQEERIYHMAGAETPQGLNLAEIVHLIRSAGREPVERDTLYNVVAEGSALVSSKPFRRQAPSSLGVVQ